MNRNILQHRVIAGDFKRLFDDYTIPSSYHTTTTYSFSQALCFQVLCMVVVEYRGCRLGHCGFQHYLTKVSVSNVKYRLEEILTH